MIESPALRKALVMELEALRALPKDAPDARAAIPALVVFTELIEHGGQLTISRDPADIEDELAVLLRMQGVGVNEATFEQAVGSWVRAARARIEKEQEKGKAR